jgi:hypothetical protein
MRNAECITHGTGSEDAEIVGVLSLRSRQYAVRSSYMVQLQQL